MQRLTLIIERITIVDVFFWGAAIFLLVVLAFWLHSALTRPSKRDIIHGMPRE